MPLPRRDNPVLVRLLREMGAIVGEDDDGEPVGAEDQLVTQPEERVFYKGRWYPGLLPRAAMTPEDVRQHELFEAEIDAWIAWRD